MNYRAVSGLFDKWADKFSNYQEFLIGGHRDFYQDMGEDDSERKQAMNWARLKAYKKLRLIEHVLVFGIKKGQITSLKQVDDFLQMQWPCEKCCFVKPFFNIEVDTQFNTHLHSVCVPRLETYPFGQVWRALSCKALHIERLPPWEKNSNKIFLSEINDTISIVWDSLLDGFKIKSIVDFHFGLEEEDWEGWLEIENIDLHGAKVTGMRLRELKTLQKSDK